MTHPLDPKALEAAAEAIWETWASMPSPDAHPIYADRSWREVTALAEGSGGPAAEIVALARAEAASSITTYLDAVGDGWCFDMEKAKESRNGFIGLTRDWKVAHDHCWWDGEKFVHGEGFETDIIAFQLYPPAPKQGDER